MDIPVIIEESVLCYLVLKVVGKKHCQFVFFYEVAKNIHIPNTKVCGKRHMGKNFKKWKTTKIVFLQ